MTSATSPLAPKTQLDLARIPLLDLYDLHTHLHDAHHAGHAAWLLMWAYTKDTTQPTNAMQESVAALCAQVSAEIDRRIAAGHDVATPGACADHLVIGCDVCH